MSARYPLATLVSGALLAASSSVLAGFGSCMFVNHRLSVGDDPINHGELALRADGRPVLAYTNGVHNAASVYFFDCANTACSAGHSVYLDTSSNYFGAPGIVMRADGRPAILATYFGGLRYYDCQDAHCNAFNVHVIRDPSNAILDKTPVALQANGNPILVYVDGNLGVRPNYVIARFCADAACADGTDKVLAMPGSTATFVGNLSAAVDSDGKLAATFLTSEGPTNLNDYQIARCNDVACTSISNTTIAAPATGSTPTDTALAIRTDKRPIALDTQSFHRVLLDCTSAACTAENDRALPAASMGVASGLKLLPGNFPAFSLLATQSITAFACADVTCTAGSSLQVSTDAVTIQDSDFALDPGGHPTVAYVDFEHGHLAVAGCVGDVIFSDGAD